MYIASDYVWRYNSSLYDAFPVLSNIFSSVAGINWILGKSGPLITECERELLWLTRSFTELGGNALSIIYDELQI